MFKQRCVCSYFLFILWLFIDFSEKLKHWLKQFGIHKEFDQIIELYLYVIYCFGFYQIQGSWIVKKLNIFQRVFIYSKISKHCMFID